MAPSGGEEKRGLSLASKILVGLAAGVACGLFFGEYCSVLKIVGDGFVGLLQMAVFPYIAVALVANVARLSAGAGKRLALAGGVTLLLFWAMCGVMIVLLPFSYPEQESAGFFSTSILESAPAVDYVSLFIPSNPFHSLANSIVPAVVVFCICLGLAIIGLPGKEALLDHLDLLARALMRLNGAIVRLTPIGVFAIAANAAGAMTLEQIERVQVHLLTYSIGVLLLAFVLLPMATAACTPFGYREIVRTSRDALIMAFATGKVLVVLPLLIARTGELFERFESEKEKAAATTEVLIPLAYPFPNLGKLMNLLFIPFSAWFVGRAMTWSEYPSFLPAGLLSYFGSQMAAMPFLLDMQGLPADMFQLFVAVGVYCGRIGDVLGAMHLFTLNVIATCAMTGLLTIRWRRLVWSVVVTMLLVLAAIIGSRAYLSAALKNVEKKSDVVGRMHMLLHPSPAQVWRTKPDRPEEDGSFASRLERIRRTRILRVGYHPDNLPFSFFNAKGELVGLDMEMAHLLARELDCRLEFVPFEFDTLAEQLDEGQIDVAMSGIAVTTSRLARMRFSAPYMDVTLAFVVRDNWRDTFSSRESIQRIDNLRIGVARSDYFRAKLREHFPRATIAPLDSPREFFVRDDLDALLTSAEAGSAWSLMYPGFQPVVPQPDVVAVPTAFAIADRAEELADFLSGWIELKKKSGEFKEVYDHWILGRDARQQAPRWCVIRDVLGWVN